LRTVYACLDKGASVASDHGMSPRSNFFQKKKK
jgi:hypothetical protein